MDGVVVPGMGRMGKHVARGMSKMCAGFDGEYQYCTKKEKLLLFEKERCEIAGVLSIWIGIQDMSLSSSKEVGTRRRMRSSPSR